MKHETIKRYAGPLSAEQIAQGMRAAAANSKRLYEDAQLLYEEARYPSACSLAILSIEEAGKLAILREMAARPDAIKSIWKSYRRHQAKNAHWIITELALKGAKRLADLTPIVDESSDHPAVLDVLKQLGFYTDCYGDAHWSEPQTIIENELARTILFTAKALVPTHETTAREIELWIECVAPYWNAPEVNRAVVEFYRRLELEGISPHTAEEMAEFLGVKPAAH